MEELIEYLWPRPGRISAGRASSASMVSQEPKHLSTAIQDTGSGEKLNTIRQGNHRVDVR